MSFADNIAACIDQGVTDNLSIANAAVVTKRYGISTVTGAVGDASDALVHAMAGAISLLRADDA